MVVVAIIGLLMAILVPALSSARRIAKSTVCLTRLRTAGQGLTLYANDNHDVLVPARLPKINEEHWRLRVVGGVKYRPTFFTIMASQIGLQPFDDPQPSKSLVDRSGQPGDRQNYSNEAYVCPEVRDWVDERNGCYGYNYQFLGNARLLADADLKSYKNWPVQSSWIRSPSQCVAVADCLGTAASFPRYQRAPYEDNEPGDSASGRTVNARGNEGFNLDPPRVDPEHGELASHKAGKEARSALHERHGRKGNVLWVDNHGSSETLESLHYDVQEDGVVTFDGDNRLFSADQSDEAWVEPE
jgi:prepilin-type processing-associated H-X9-DG protein